jgi:unsaturated rhamnogalacturonyl hydrolase
MAASNDHIMPFDEQTHFIGEIKKKIQGVDPSEYDRFNHPKALLYSGLTDYAMAKKDTALMEEMASLFEEMIQSQGNDIYNRIIVDQIPFGVTALNLYLFFGDDKYKKHADIFFDKLKYFAKNETSTLIFYRQDQKGKFYIVDTLGMICPFLIRYGTIFENQFAIDLATRQLKYYSENGLDGNSYLPSHAVLQGSEIKVGPHNWGRGIGWYFLPVSEYMKIVDGEIFKVEVEGIIESMEQLKMDQGYWSQFPGTSDKFDASPTVMYMYGKNAVYPKTYNKKDLFRVLGGQIDKNGRIGPTSGGAFGINNYSRTFGDSELTQGVLLMLLSTVQD